jgi:hypothetical protein
MGTAPVGKIGLIIGEVKQKENVPWKT